MPHTCDNCDTVNAETMKFCGECGTPLTRVCPACGMAGTTRFCGACGTLMAAAPAPSPQTTAQTVSERRTTTVLFGDLVSFTTLSESRDPEEVRELLSTYFAAVRTVVGRYGGTIEKFIGDAVMAVWGVPVSHEDDAERAVRAGLDLVKEVAALGSTVGAPDLALRVGIVTGSVAVTLGAVNEGMVAGDAVNTAARVQTAATPGTVWVDQETQGLTAAAVSFSDMGEHALKGKTDPMRLFRADTVVAAVGGVQRVDGLEAPMVGRERELRTVRELLHATEEDGRARLAVVTGLAGVGKSRLGWEFEKYVDGLNVVVRWHRGRCLSYGEGVAFWAFAEMIRSRLGLLESDDQAEVARKVEAGVAEVAATASEVAWLTPRVAALLGSGEGEVYDRTDLFASWTTFLERVGGDDTVVLLFEDMQYADSGMLDLVEHLLATSRSKLFVMILTRPELLERRSSIASGRRTTAVELEPLAAEAMTQLCDGLVADLPERARAALVARAEGVPLYAVETVRSLIDRDAVIAHEGHYVFVDHDHQLVDLDQLTAPITLQTLIAARLDTLPPAERRVVQDASVLGLTFGAKTLAELSDLPRHGLDLALASLVRRGILDTESDPRSPELGQYRFLQAIFREVAYSTISRKDRRARHLAVASCLEREEVAEAAAGVIAQHLLDALEASPPDDAERPAVVERARVLLIAAAVRSEALGSPGEALRSALAALSLAPGPEETAELMLRAGRLALLAGEPRRSEELASEAVDRFKVLARPGDAAEACAVQARALMGIGRVTDADAVASRALEEADGGDSVTRGVQVELLLMRAAAARVAGDHLRHYQHTIRILQLAEEMQDPAYLVRSLNTLAIILVDAGCSTAHRAILDQAVKRARDGHLIGELGRSLGNLCSETYLYDLETASGLATESVEVSLKVGDSYAIEVSLMNAGMTWWLLGEWDRVTSTVTEWLEGRETTTMTGSVWVNLARIHQARGERVAPPRLPDTEDPFEQLGNDVVRAMVEAFEGDLGAAAVRSARALRSTYAESESMEDFEIMWAPVMELQVRAGHLAEAAGLMELADPLLGDGARPLARAEVPRIRALVKAARGEDPEADLRAAEAAHSSYGAPYLLAQTRLELARWLTQQGRTVEALPLLQAARPVFVELRATPSVEAVDELMPASVPV